MKPLLITLKENMSRPKRWLFLARMLAVLFMLFLAAIFITGVVEYPGFAASHPEKLTTWGWSPQEMDLVLGKIGLSFDGWVQWNLVSAVGFALLVCAIGIFLFIQKNNDWFGLYLSVSFFMFGTLSGYMAGVVAAFHPGLNPILIPLGVFSWVSLIMVLFLFPTGRFVPVWTRWIATVILISFSVDVIFYHGASPPPFLLLPMMLLIASGPVSQVYRYRKVSNALERQQTKLVMLAMVLVVSVLMLGLIPLLTPRVIDPREPAAVVMMGLTAVNGFIMGLIPLSITMAVLRYRLWDIDLIIRRTLLYAALSAALGLVYFGSVVLLQQIFRAVSGQNSPAAVALSTLAIVVIFTPLRRRLQAGIDRRFYRSKYNAEQAVAAFAAAARSETALDALTGHMLSAVNQTVQPEQVSLWLRERQ